VGDNGMRILEKHKDLAKYIYIVLRQYPKSERYTLAAVTRRLLGETEKDVKRASVIPNKAVKKRLIEQVDEQRAGLNFLIEMGLELPFVNVEK
jgi:hypothetical protein